MKILVLGSVAKEHALVRWISQSKEDVKVYAYPGNPGMNGLATVIKRSDVSDVDAVVNIVKSRVVKRKSDIFLTTTTLGLKSKKDLTIYLVRVTDCYLTTIIYHNIICL